MKNKSYLTRSVADHLAEKLLGHAHVRSLLERLVIGDRLPHALLFSGPPAIGKKTAALAFAGAFMEMERRRRKHSERPWLDASLIASGNHPDLHFLTPEEDKKDIAVESVRTFISELQLQPFFAPVRVGLINDAHRLSIAAANALLMTLEEPPPNTLIILISEAEHRLAQTIRSRCQNVHFSYLTEDELQSILSRLIAEASLSEPELASRLSAACDGTLAILGLSPFFEQKTGCLEKKKELAEHLQLLLSESLRLNELLNPAKLQGRGLDLSSLTKLSSRALAGESKEERHRRSAIWAIERNLIRKMVFSRDLGPEERKRWASLLLHWIEVERLVTERNANPELQVANFFIALAP